MPGGGGGGGDDLVLEHSHEQEPGTHVGMRTCGSAARGFNAVLFTVCQATEGKRRAQWHKIVRSAAPHSVQPGDAQQGCP